MRIHAKACGGPEGSWPEPPLGKDKSSCWAGFASAPESSLLELTPFLQFLQQGAWELRPCNCGANIHFRPSHQGWLTPFQTLPLPSPAPFPSQILAPNEPLVPQTPSLAPNSIEPNMQQSPFVVLSTSVFLQCDKKQRSILV